MRYRKKGAVTETQNGEYNSIGMHAMDSRQVTGAYEVQLRIYIANIDTPQA